MLKYEDFPKKCIKCKRTDVPLEKFQIGYVKGKYIQGSSTSRVRTIATSSYSIKFPVCRTCKGQFSRFLRLRQLFHVILLINVFTLLLLILFTFVPAIPHIDLPFNILPFIISFSAAIIFAIIVRSSPNKIKNFIDATEKGVIIKDSSYETELVEHKKTRLIDDILEINKIPCPKCGTLMRKDADFCLSCGKDLRSY